MKILVLNGVNISMTGARGALYGDEGLDSINARLKSYVERNGGEAEFFQSNIEGEIVDRIQKLDYDALIINAGAYSHYSYAIADALEYVHVKKIEVHFTNVLAREGFRHDSVTAAKCDGVISGFGADSYFIAAGYLLDANK